MLIPSTGGTIPRPKADHFFEAFRHKFGALPVPKVMGETRAKHPPLAQRGNSPASENGRAACMHFGCARGPKLFQCCLRSITEPNDSRPLVFSVAAEMFSTPMESADFRI